MPEVERMSWAKRNPERRKDYNLRRDYGITLEQALERYAEQGGRCGICENEIDFWKKNTHVDHCHDTGTFRGILCHTCNLGLGQLGDTMQAVEMALIYLKRTI